MVVENIYDYPKMVKLCSEERLKNIPQGTGFSQLYKDIWETLDSLLIGINTILKPARRQAGLQLENLKMSSTSKLQLSNLQIIKFFNLPSFLLPQRPP